MLKLEPLPNLRIRETRPEEVVNQEFETPAFHRDAGNLDPLDVRQTLEPVRHGCRVGPDLHHGFAAVAPRARVKVLDAPPLVGAALLGLDHVGARSTSRRRLRAALTEERLSSDAPARGARRGQRDRTEP